MISTHRLLRFLLKTFRFFSSFFAIFSISSLDKLVVDELTAKDALDVIYKLKDKLHDMNNQLRITQKDIENELKKIM